MAFKPVILLLDEPTSGLDPAARRRLDAIINTASQSTTVVCADYSTTQLATCISNVCELAAGRLVYKGPRNEDDSKQPIVNGNEGSSAPAGPKRNTKIATKVGERLETVQQIPKAVARAGPLIAIQDANVWLGDRHVLRNFSWQLSQNEHWLITGPNGSGKSTFLRLLHGQLRPAVGGSVTWPALGNPRNIWQLRAQVGYVSAELQAAYRYPTTVHDCIASGFESSIGLTKRRTPEELKHVSSLLTRFELEAFASRFLDTLSYGQMHRVLIARTLASGPRVLLLDEPWEGLDRPTRALVRDQLASAMMAGTQIVCVSHVGAEGLPFTKLLKLANGRAASADARVELDEN